MKMRTAWIFEALLLVLVVNSVRGTTTTNAVTNGATTATTTETTVTTNTIESTTEGTYTAADSVTTMSTSATTGTTMSSASIPNNTTVTEPIASATASNITFVTNSAAANNITKISTMLTTNATTTKLTNATVTESTESNGTDTTKDTNSTITTATIANVNNTTTTVATMAANTTNVEMINGTTSTATSMTTTMLQSTTTAETTTSATKPSTVAPTTTESSTTASPTTTESSTIIASPPTTLSTSAPTTEEGERETDSGTIILAVCLTLLAIVIIVFAIVCYFYVTGKNLPCMGTKGSGSEIITNEMPMHTTTQSKFVVGHMYINEEDFETQYKRKTADDGRGYREEFRAVQTESSSTGIARDSTNVAKNRYDNVLPWDSTRVVLSVPPDGDPKSDYINANFVPGYLQEKKFIACQGPKEETCGDFWKMIWEQKCATIVMVTNLIEAKKPKCNSYWPGGDAATEGATGKFGNFVVTVADVTTRNFFVTRTLKLQLFDYPPRIIRQLHYTAWPDFGVPSNPAELLLFRRRVIASNPPHSGPIVVHCSAGVGRTGTFILLDAAMEQLQAEGKVDLFSFLTKMRKYRMMLVQTDAQYTFVHACVLEHVKYAETEVSVKKYRSQVQMLREPSNEGEDNLLEKQFSTLLKIQLAKDNMKHGRSSIKKNRVLQIIPYDKNRVTLPLKPGQEKSDYINASFIDGFKDKNMYIATQGPLSDTISDFWIMIWVYQVQNIVMLTELIEKGQQMCAQYWPTELNEEVTHGEITIKFVSQDDDDVVDYTVREFIISNSNVPDEERKIRQFHYHGWPEVGLPSDAHGMIEIANRLTTKDKNGYPRPSVIHCSSGGGRTGVFISLNILMKQADNEGLVDVFQTVKSLRQQRPHIIQTQDQFYFCYIALLQYLETNQMADSTTLTSNLGTTSSVGNHTPSVTPSNGAVPISPTLLGTENNNMGSMNNKLDCNSIQEETLVKVQESPADPTSQTSETQSGNSINQALLKEAINVEEAGQTTSTSSNSEFEVVDETNPDTTVKV